MESAPEPTGDADLAVVNGIAMTMIRVSRLQASVAAHLSKAGIDKAAYVLLATLAANGPSRSSALAEAVYSDPSTVSRQVAQLVKDGLVERRADPEDGRASVLAATEAGCAFLDSSRERRNAALARMFGDWSPEDLGTFAAAYERFADAYERSLQKFITECGLGSHSGGEK
ncbi:MarR family transcriptional regulator [Solihabitans fulvus]|uniref:MarR family transcriptional regulator n=2 Tax=Solihabitans fulvus TaxID=1892852 RepID=A0A5B2XI06_9PSEU|nr:MarR family transcriptional regulator [Solihabitans fulvus]